MFLFDYLSSREFSYFRGIKQKLKDLRRISFGSVQGSGGDRWLGQGDMRTTCP